MRPRVILLRLLMDELNWTTDQFRNRLYIQKSIYLMQLLGLHLRYYFCWYQKGPYDPKLTEEMFEAANDPIITERAKGYRLGPDAHKVIQEFEEIRSNRPANITALDWLELLTALHFIARHWRSIPNHFEAVVDELVSRRPEFADKRDAARAAWQVLEERGLLSKGD